MTVHACSSRRHVLGGAVALGVCAPVLAACGADKDTPDDVPDAGTELAGTGEVPVGGGVILKDQNVVLTQPTKGDFKAFEATCTHAGCTVTSVSTTITCSCHGSQFELADGSVAHGPATAALPAVKIAVKGQSILTA